MHAHAMQKINDVSIYSSLIEIFKKEKMHHEKIIFFC